MYGVEAFVAVHVIPTLPVAPAQLKGLNNIIGQNESCAL